MHASAMDSPKREEDRIDDAKKESADCNCIIELELMSYKPPGIDTSRDEKNAEYGRDETRQDNLSLSGIDLLVCLGSTEPILPRRLCRSHSRSRAAIADRSRYRIRSSGLAVWTDLERYQRTQGQTLVCKRVTVKYDAIFA